MNCQLINEPINCFVFVICLPLVLSCVKILIMVQTIINRLGIVKMTYIQPLLFKNTINTIKIVSYEASRHYSYQSYTDFNSKFGKINMTSWFPGHMYRGTKLNIISD